ncbi:MAG: hypothetical protein O1I36_17630, partial [Cylindrospermopsis raciborskii PAMP2011]|nr:hypothetical protein [Cylindrospermopsis raciborskii PAMP2011]
MSDESDDEDQWFDFGHYRAWLKKEKAREDEARKRATPIIYGLLGCCDGSKKAQDELNNDDDDDDDDTFYRGDADYQDLESYLVLQAELDEAARDSAKRLAVEHSYSRSEASSSRGESARPRRCRRRPGTFEYHFLYAVCLSG